MPRPVSFLPALVAVLAIGTMVPVALPASATEAPRRPRDDSPLRVRIDTLTPSYIPVRGLIRISGVVTNRSDETWDSINLHPFVSDQPITTSAELAAARELPTEEYVGDRIYAEGTFDNVPVLEPGESAPFSIKLARSQVDVEAEGVYWFGVHALGASAAGRDLVADGRARTFLPLVPRTRRTVNTALVIPIRHPIRHTADGRVEGVEAWARTLSSGTLRRLVDFGAAAGSRSLTWLVDPAVIDTVRSLVAGNLPRSLEDDDPPAAPGDDGGSEVPEPTDETAPTEGSTPEAPPDVEPNAATEPGEAWLNRLRAAVEGNQVLALPYGDLDVPAALKHDPELYQRARRRSGSVLAPWELPMSPAVGSPSGYLDPAVVADLPRETTVLMTDQMVEEGTPTAVRVDGRRIITTSTSTAAGGPGPDAPLGMVAVRQQVLAEAALRLLNPGRQPLVVVLPDDWRPDASPGFFSGLDVDWLTLTGVDTLTARKGKRLEADALGYPDEQVVRELDAASFASAEGLIALGRTLEAVLANNDAVAGTVRDEALTGLSYATRADPDSARAEIDRSSRWIDTQLASIRVTAPPGVTLSSTRGGFSATITNDLDHAVRVRLESVADAPMRISDTEPIEIPAGGRTTVLLEAATNRLGVYNVELLVTTEEGVPLGSTDTLPIRSNQVSDVIWLIMGTGVALLFGAIAVRLVRRIRRARAAA